MALNVHTGIDETARKIKSVYMGINNVAQQITKIYVGVDSAARLTWSGGTLWGAPKISFNYDANGVLLPYLDIEGAKYVFLADLKSQDFITATNTIYLYDGVEILPVVCGGFSGYYQADKEFMVLGDIKTKISGYIRGDVE